MQHDSVKWEIKASLDKWEIAQNEIKAWFLSKSVSKQDVLTILMAAEELVSNIVFYAFPDSYTGDETIQITCYVNGETISITLEDGGIQFDPTNQPQPDPECIERVKTPGGWGLYIARQKTDKMEYSRNGDINRLTITNNINREGV